jgi:hypothetical protein
MSIRRVEIYRGRIIITDGRSFGAFGTGKRFIGLALIKRAVRLGLIDSGVSPDEIMNDISPLLCNHPSPSAEE